MAAEPASPGIRTELAAELRALGRHAEAEAACADALRLRPGFAPALLGLALSARLRGDHAAALARFEAAAAADPDNPGLRAELAATLRDAGRSADAEAAWQAALALRPGFVPALVGLGLAARRRGDPGTALARFEAAAAADPANPGLRAELAATLRDAGRSADAEAAWQDALRLRPGFVPALVGLGLAARRRGDRAAALAHFEAAAAAAPGTLSVLLELAAERREQGDLEGARDAARRALAVEPGHAAAWISLGQTERRAARHEAARDAFARAHAADPKALPPVLDLAAEHFLLGDPDAAEALLQHAIAAHPRAAAPRAALARQHRIAGRFAAAIALGREADALEPGLRPAALTVAEALFESAQPEAALAELAEAEQACAAAEHRASLAAARITLLRRAGRIPEAVAAARAAGAAQPGEFGLWHARCLAELRLGDAAAAAACFAAAPPAVTPAQRHALASCRAEAAELRGDHATAEAEMAEAARHAPTAPFPHDVLARLALLRWDAAAVRHHLGEALRLQAGEVALGRRQGRFNLTLPGQLLDEAALTPGLTAALAAALALPEPVEAVAAVAAVLRANPDVTAPAMALLVALRRQGPLVTPDPDAPPIPRAIGQFWDTGEPPADVAGIMASWEERNPGHALRRFDTASAITWLAAHDAPKTLAAFLRADGAAQRADLFRLAWLARQGGLWVDADDRCLAPIEAVLPAGAALVGVQEDLGSCANNLLAAAPEHPVILRALRDAVAALNRGDGDIVWLATGPGLVTRSLGAAVLEASGDGRIGLPPGVAILDRRAVMPCVAMHAAAAYKTTSRYWQHPGRRRGGAAETRVDPPETGP